MGSNGEGAVLLSLPFFHRMKEVLGLFQAASFSTPSFTQLQSQTETLETIPNKELSHG